VVVFTIRPLLLEKKKTKEEKKKKKKKKKKSYTWVHFPDRYSLDQPPLR